MIIKKISQSSGIVARVINGFDGTSEIDAGSAKNDKILNDTINYITLIPDISGKYKTNLNISSFISGQIYHLFFNGNATVGSDVAQISLDNGNNYITAKSYYNLTLIADDVENKYLDVYYNGTNFILKDELIIDLLATSGNSTRTISQTAENFYQMEFEASLSGGTRVPLVKIINPNGKSFNSAFEGIDSSEVRIFACKWSISGVTITPSNYFYCSVGNTSYDTSVNYIHIMKIIGIK